MNYHRGVPQEQQKHLSLESRMEGILRFADWELLVATIKHDCGLAYDVFSKRTIHDIMISSKHKKLLAFIFKQFGYDSTKGDRS